MIRNRAYHSFCVMCCFLLFLFSCQTVDSVLDNAERINRIADTTGVGSRTNAGTGGVDFKEGEVLCCISESSSILEAKYKAAQILTAPSEGTKNQAEVLYANGDKKWTPVVLYTHKAGEDEMVVGRPVLYSWAYSHHEDMNQKEYREANWQFGRITSTDELFKGVVEIGGKPRYVKWVRVPDEPVE